VAGQLEHDFTHLVLTVGQYAAILIDAFFVFLVSQLQLTIVVGVFTRANWNVASSTQADAVCAEKAPRMTSKRKDFD